MALFLCTGTIVIPMFKKEYLAYISGEHNTVIYFTTRGRFRDLLMFGLDIKNNRCIGVTIFMFDFNIQWKKGAHQSLSSRREKFLH